MTTLMLYSENVSEYTVNLEKGKERRDVKHINNSK